MFSGEERPKILAVGQDSGTWQTLRVLLTSMGCHCILAADIRQALGLIDVENPDAAVLDAEALDFSPTPAASFTAQICSELRGRVIILCGETIVPSLSDFIRQFQLPQVDRGRLFHELWPKLQTALRREPLFVQIRCVAQLIFDSFREPLPAGIRRSHRSGRRLLCRFGSLLADLWLDPQENPARMTLVGQIADSARPDFHLNDCPVSLLGEKGTIGNTTTNALGEFQMDFEAESSPLLEIKIRTGQSFTVTLPVQGTSVSSKMRAEQ
jgi:hypothetical protein